MKKNKNEEKSDYLKVLLLVQLQDRNDDIIVSKKKKQNKHIK